MSDDLDVDDRTSLVDGVAYVQSGGGIVADSDPPTEDQESQNKAAAVVAAIGVAQSFRPIDAGLDSSAPHEGVPIEPVVR